MDNRPLLITGASSDLGRSLMARLCARGEAPLILAHYLQGREALADAISKAGPEARIVPVCADFRNIADVKEFGERIIAEHGVPSRIVHLPAARLKYERFPQMDMVRLDEDFTIQVRSITELLRMFLPRLPRPATGAAEAPPNAKVVFVLSSVTCGIPAKYMSGYTVIKYALLGLLRALAAEYGGVGCNINGVSPSMIETQFLNDIPAKAIEMAAAAHPARRNATPADIVPLIQYLLSPESDYVNGVNIPVAGGQAV